jgi:DNA-binding NarL/FixJ family response regulator
VVAAVEALQYSRTFFTSRMTEMVLDGYLANSQALTNGRRGRELKSRQREIVQLVAEGKSTKEISSILRLSVKTAETHRHNIMSSC